MVKVERWVNILETGKNLSSNITAKNVKFKVKTLSAKWDPGRHYVIIIGRI